MYTNEIYLACSVPGHANDVSSRKKKKSVGELSYHAKKFSGGISAWCHEYTNCSIFFSFCCTKNKQLFFFLNKRGDATWL